MGEARPKVIIIAGLNGAGKTALAPLLLRNKFDLSDYVNAVVYDDSFTGKPILIAEGVGGIIKHLRQKDLWLGFCEAKDDHTN